MSDSVYHVTKTDPYLQMAKNTVNAKGQLPESEYIKFDNPNGTGARILFVGNSITLHGVCHEIGWHHAWGKAASAMELDYVHRVKRAVRESDPDAALRAYAQTNGYPCIPLGDLGEDDAMP